MVIVETPITVCVKWHKKKVKKREKKIVIIYFFKFIFNFALALHSSSGWDTICIGERTKIIYEYIIKNLKYRKMHSHVNSYA